MKVTTTKDGQTVMLGDMVKYELNSRGSEHIFFGEVKYDENICAFYIEGNGIYKYTGEKILKSCGDSYFHEYDICQLELEVVR